jgi:hypothetical protein
MSKLTHEQHLAMAQCLRKVKQVLRKTRSDGMELTNNKYLASCVCLAVDESKFYDFKTKKLVHDWIESQIKGFAFVTDWARKNSNIDFSTYEHRQAYRHAWVDHMIKVLES